MVIMMYMRPRVSIRNLFNPRGVFSVVDDNLVSPYYYRVIYSLMRSENMWWHTDATNRLRPGAR
jgi:hypothetical protein